MRTIIPGANNFKHILSRIMMGLIFVSMIGGLFVVTAFGDDHRGWANRDEGDDHRGWTVHQDDRYGHGRRDQRSSYGYGHGYGYRAPAYVAPPFFYEPPPPPSPGITIFFPPIIIR